MAEPGKYTNGKRSGKVVGANGNIINDIRAKSLNDIYKQRDRIIAGSRGNDSRIERAVALANRYAENIRRTDEYALDSSPSRRNEWYEAAKQKGYTTAAEANADPELVRKYGTYLTDFFNNGIGGIVPHRTYGRKYTKSQYAK